MRDHDIGDLYAPAFLSSINIGHDDGLFRPKLVTNI